MIFRSSETNQDGSGAVTERKLGDHQPGQLLKPSIVVEEMKVVDGSSSNVLCSGSVLT